MNFLLVFTLEMTVNQGQTFIICISKSLITYNSKKDLQSVKNDKSSFKRKGKKI